MTIGRMRIEAGALALLLLGYLADTGGLFPFFLLASALHELSHAVAVSLAGGRVRAFVLGPLGGEMQVEAPLSYARELFVTAAGPAVNLLCAYLVSTAARVTPLAGTAAAGPLYLFAGLSVLLGVFNLLPVRPLDGGEILYILLCMRTDCARAERVSRWTGLAVSALLVAFGVYILVKTRYNGTMLAAGAFTLAAALRGLWTGGLPCGRRRGGRKPRAEYS